MFSWWRKAPHCIVPAASSWLLSAATLPAATWYVCTGRACVANQHNFRPCTPSSASKMPSHATRCASHDLHEVLSGGRCLILLPGDEHASGKHLRASRGVDSNSRQRQLLRASARIGRVPSDCSMYDPPLLQESQEPGRLLSEASREPWHFCMRASVACPFGRVLARPGRCCVRLNG